MSNKLFGLTWQRQTKLSLELLDNAGIDTDFIAVDASPTHIGIFNALVEEETKLPVLFVDGVMYGGVDGVRDYITTI